MARILIIDDDNKVLGTYARILEHAGYEVMVASDGKGGIRAFYEKPYDLVITDIIMPEMKGIEIIKRPRHDFPDAKIIAISGGGDGMGPENYLIAANLWGAMCTLTKPIEREALLKAVRECLS